MTIYRRPSVLSASSTSANAANLRSKIFKGRKLQKVPKAERICHMPTTYMELILYLPLFTQYLYCIRYYKQIRDDLKYERMFICKYQCYALSYKELDYPQIVVSLGVLEPIPYQYWGQLYSYLKNSIITLGTNQENLIFICQFNTLFYLSSILS